MTDNLGPARHQPVASESVPDSGSSTGDETSRGARFGALRDVSVRTEVIYVALAAAEVSWVAPLFISLTVITSRHPPLLLWLGMLVLLFGYCSIYRALSRANLSMPVQQTILVLLLLLSMGLFLRYHVYTGAGLQGTEWLMEPVRRFADVQNAIPDEWLAMLTLIYFWARGIMLARRSLSADSVGSSFRVGLLIFVWCILIIALITGQDASPFVVAFFFFALIATAMARIEDVSQTRASSLARFSGFRLFTTLGSVTLLIALGGLLAFLLRNVDLRKVLLPFFIVLEVIVVGLILVILAIAEWVFTGLRLDQLGLGDRLQELFSQLKLVADNLTVPFGGEEAGGPPAAVSIVKIVTSIAIPVVLIALVVLFTWWQIRRARARALDDSRESIWSPSALARDLKALLQAGREQLGGIVDLVDRFGLGARLLRALTIRRIYANLVRLATELGHPRYKTQTPYEYKRTLYEALPGSEDDVDTITEAYVRAHYGEVPDTREQVDRIRACWKSIQATTKRAGKEPN